ncbi:type II secretion system protein [Vibrio hepatarius]|uniref:type II secretion system protein n=1 Tax=Vibrio hepatarius TaxID=171383 RepID=UPI00148B40DB|nr:type II secretion system protein [Vibrio hepatarius]NOI15711.1 type II secretion system protein [Vibrio hepatarius]
MKAKSAQGFTLVELIVVILLLAIVSVYATSRMFGRDSVAAMVIQEQVISVVRQVQVNRMQSNLPISGASNTNFTLSVQPSCVGSQRACSLRSDARSDWVSSQGGVAFSVNTGSTINFDLLGNPVGSAASGAVITIAAQAQSCQVEINSQGYVFSGGCS